MDKIAAELLEVAKELTADKSRTAGNINFSFRRTFRDGGGEYRAYIDPGHYNVPQLTKLIDGVGRQMWKRMEKAGVEPDTPEVVVTEGRYIVIFQDEVTTVNPDGSTSGVSKEQIDILTR